MFNQIPFAFKAIWIIGMILGLALTVTGIWLLIELINYLQAAT